MKKVLSLVLVLALVLGMMPVFAAGETGAEMLYKYGFIAGNNGDLMVDKELTRAEMAVLVAEMNGLKDEAANYAAPANFGDVEAGKWYTPYVAYGQAQGWWSGYPDGTFKPEAGMSGQEFAAVLMNALKYDYTWNTVVADSAAIGVNVATTGFNRGAAFEAMWAAVNKPVKGEEVALGVKLGRLESAMATEGPLAVDTVMANTAKSFEVKFKNAVADTSKVTFAVTRETTKVALTAAWNEAKTVATLSSTAKLPEGNFEIVVTGDGVALGTFKVTVEKEKVAKVEFDADTLSRFTDEKGTVGYKVLNQYNEDITNTGLGRGLTWISSTNVTSPDVDAKTGVITVEQTDAAQVNQLRHLKTVVITARDTSTGFVVTKSLSVSDTISAVNEIKINGIVNEKGESVDFVYGTAKSYFLDFTALDANGKEVTAYSVLSAKIGPAPVPPAADTRQKLLDITSSNTTYVTITPENDNGRMKYRLTLAAVGPTYDTPVTFIAVAPYTGKNASQTFTLKKAAVVEKFNLQSPAVTVSSGKSIEFPFEAFDQNGAAITDYDKLVNKIDFGSAAFAGGVGFKFIRQSDGSAKLYGVFTTANPNGETKYVTATVKNSTTGSFSQISFTVKPAATPDSLSALLHSKAYTTGSSWNRRISNFTIRDKYDNTMNLRTDATNANDYALRVTTSAPTVVAVTTDTGKDITANTQVIISGDSRVYFTGKAAFGTATITYELLKVTRTAGVDTVMNTADDVVTVVSVIDSATATAYNIDPADITSVRIDDVEGEVTFMDTKAPAYDISTEATVVGLTSDGTVVRLPGSSSAEAVKVSSLQVSNSKFAVNGMLISNTGTYTSETTDSTTVTALVYGAKGVLQATATMKASADLPVTKDIYLDITPSFERLGIYSVTNNVVEVAAADVATYLAGTSVYNTDALAGDLVFYANTNYGDDNGLFNTASITKIASGVVTTGNLAVTASTGLITETSAVQVGDEYSLTVTSGAVSETIIIKIK